MPAQDTARRALVGAAATAVWALEAKDRGPSIHGSAGCGDFIWGERYHRVPPAVNVIPGRTPWASLPRLRRQRRSRPGRPSLFFLLLGRLVRAVEDLVS